METHPCLTSSYHGCFWVPVIGYFLSKGGVQSFSIPEIDIHRFPHNETVALFRFRATGTGCAPNCKECDNANVALCCDLDRVDVATDWRHDIAHIDGFVARKVRS